MDYNEIKSSHNKHKQGLQRLNEFIHTLDNCEPDVFVIMHNKTALCISENEFYFFENYLGSTSLVFFEDKESANKFIESVKWYSGEVYNELLFRGKTLTSCSLPVSTIKRYIQEKMMDIQQGIDKIEVLLSVFKKENKGE